MSQLLMPRAILLISLFFVLQIPLLQLGSCSAPAFAVDRNDGSAATPAAAAAAGTWRRRLLPTPVARAQTVRKVKATAHPRSMERSAAAAAAGGGGRSAFMNAVSKHQVPSGANPDSN
ncbi:hypothetical protein ACP4OV_020724 [Aristida adscensionis]